MIFEDDFKLKSACQIIKNYNYIRYYWKIWVFGILDEI